MRLSRRARMTLGAIGAVLLFGLLGLAWWLWRHRHGYEPVARFPRGRSALVAVILVIIAVGAVWRFAVAFESVSACTPPGGAQTASGRGPFDPWLATQQVATWPETGIGMLYARSSGARLCLSHAADYYVAINEHHIAGTRAMTVGDIVLSPGFHVSKEALRTLIGHEARHRTQWAIGTIIGGPFAFPIAYGIEDFFFPGSRNLFERQAGLAAGGYRHVGLGPVLGPAQLAVLGVLTLIVVGALVAARRRRSVQRRRPQVKSGD